MHEFTISQIFWILIIFLKFAFDEYISLVQFFRLIVESATANGGVIVSNDKFRDLVYEERGKFRAAIENRRVSFNFLNNNFFPTRDNLGKNGPGLDELLEF